jgi:hypothetical protein
MASRQG